MKEKILSLLALFTSTGTLVCCALPALFVSLGMGAAVAALVSTAPWLVTLSRHKVWIFTGSGLLIAASFFLVHAVPRFEKSPAVCDVPGTSRLQRFSRPTLWASLVIYLIGICMAYLFLPVKLYLEGS